MPREFYLVHYLRQSCGWVKIAEYAFDSREARDARQDAIIAQYPDDVMRFEKRQNRGADMEAVSYMEGTR